MKLLTKGFVALPALLATLFLFPALAHAETGGAVYIKGGVMSLLDPSQTVGQSGVPTFVHIDRQSEAAYNFSWELRLKHGLAVGTEYMYYRNEFAPVSTPAARGFAKTNIFSVMLKKYFMQESNIRPYVGVGLGYAFTWVDNSAKGGLLDDDNNNFAGHIVVGTEIRHDNLSFLVEVRGQEVGGGYQKTDYSPDGIGAFLGMGFAW